MKSKINYYSKVTSPSQADQQAVAILISLPSYTEILHQDIHDMVKSLKKQAKKISDRIARKRIARVIKHYEGAYKTSNIN